MYEGCVSDLRAAGLVERLDPAQVHKGRVRDSPLVAGAHAERVNLAQVHESRIRGPAATTHLHNVKSCIVHAYRLECERNPNR